MPINLTIVLTPSESAVLNIIRHCNNIQTRVMSLSLFEVMSGMTENTVKKALNSLKRLNLIEKGAVCKAGTYYSINYKTLYTLIWRLNAERNPVERMRIADSFRGEDDAINTKLIILIKITFSYSKIMKAFFKLIKSISRNLTLRTLFRNNLI